MGTVTTQYDPSFSRKISLFFLEMIFLNGLDHKFLFSNCKYTFQTSKIQASNKNIISLERMQVNLHAFQMFADCYRPHGCYNLKTSRTLCMDKIRCKLIMFCPRRKFHVSACAWLSRLTGGVEIEFRHRCVRSDLNVR